ncbi:TlpA disulfide reductase family protein [Paenibacillus sp. BSR1-1]|uniref:TlpA family protein disulfide reductase n=1 Tax=Paenibacillus sp. BSR1-1 TaxID=3020845 RepID=UPI0025B0B0F8|nr:TlpA disulfide reductase family protein [Paenibacillus sp. BSR1-1]MDN3016555.1 TlpA disulfide reductase family protein [Paenibacillus sp. BSR1-1]
MNKRVGKLLVMILIVGMFGFFGYSLVTKGKHTDVGDKAYNFELPNLDGSKTKLTDYKGEVVILNYFASWCAPCKQEFPELAAFQKDYGKKYPLIMINRGETMDRINKVTKKNQEGMTYLFDYNAKISKLYNVTGQPETFVIDKQGIIREHYNGPVTEMQLYNWVKKYDK